MTRTTTVRVDRATHDELKRLAKARQTTVADTVALAVRALRQDTMGAQLADDGSDESAWLDAELG